MLQSNFTIHTTDITNPRDSSHSFRVFRWNKNSDQTAANYVCVELNLDNLVRAADPDDGEGLANLKRKLADPQKMGNYQTKGWFYMLESGLQTSPDNAPASITLYSEYVLYDRNTAEVFSCRITGNTSKYYQAFYDARYRPVQAYNPSSLANAPFGLYASEWSDYWYFVFYNPDVKTHCQQYLAPYTGRPNTPCALTTAADFETITSGLAQSVINSIHTAFYAVIASGTQPLPMPSAGSISNTNAQYFNNNFLAEHPFRMISIGKLRLGQLDQTSLTGMGSGRQTTFMCNASPAEVAASLGLNHTYTYQWLYPGGSLFGDYNAYRNTRQVNTLLLGTTYSNAQFLMLESQLRAFVAKGDTLFLQVSALCASSQSTTPGHTAYASWLSRSVVYSITLLRRTTNTPDYIVKNPRKWYTFNIQLNSFLTNQPTVAEQLIVQGLIESALAADMDQVVSDFEKTHQASTEANSLFIRPSAPLTIPTVQKSLSLLGKDNVLFAEQTFNGTIVQTTDGSYFSSNPGAPLTLSDLFNGLSSLDPYLIFFDSKLTLINTNGVCFMEFMGDLLMSQNSVSQAFSALINNSSMATFTGSVYFKNPPGTLESGGKLDPVYIELESLNTNTLPLQHLGNQVAALGVGLQLTVSPTYSTSTQGWNWNMRATGILAFHNLDSATAVLLELIMLEKNDALWGFAEGKSIKNIFLLEHLILDYLSAEFEYGPNVTTYQLRAEYTPAVKTFQFGGQLNQSGYGLYCNQDELTFDDLNDIFVQLSGGLSLSSPDPDWHLSFSGVRLSIADTLDFQVDDESLPSGFAMQATVQVLGYTTIVTGNFTSAGLQLKGDIVFQAVQNGLTLTEGALLIDFSPESTRLIMEGNLQYQNVQQRCTVYCTPDERGTLAEVVVADIDPAAFGIDDLLPAAANSMLSAFNFSKACLVATNSSGVFNWPNGQTSEAITLTPGIQFRGVLAAVPYVAPLVHDQLKGATVIINLGETPVNSFDLTPPSPLSLNLGAAVTCQPGQALTAVLTPTPALQMPLSITINNIPNQAPISFADAVLDVNVARATSTVALAGSFSRFMGIPGLNLTGMTLETNILYQLFAASGLPNQLRLVSSLQVPNLDNIPVALDLSEDATADILVADLPELSNEQLKALIAQFSSTNNGPSWDPTFWALANPTLYFVPSGVEPGAHLGGSLSLWGNKMPNPFAGLIRTSFGTLGSTTINPGLVGTTEFSSLNIGTLQLFGKHEQPGTVQMNYSAASLQMQIDAAIVFLGIPCDGQVQCNYTGSTNSISLQFQYNFSEWLSCLVAGTGTGDLNDPTTLAFSLQSSLDQPLLNYVQGLVVEKFNAAFYYMDKQEDSNIVDIEMDAQMALNSALNNPKQDLEAARASYLAVFQARQHNLTNIQATYKSNLATAQTALQNAQSQFYSALESAQNDVVETQAAYNLAMRYAEQVLNNANAQYDRDVASAEVALEQAKVQWNKALSRLSTAASSATVRIGELDNEIAYLQNRQSQGFWYKKPYFTGLINEKQAEQQVSVGFLTYDRTALNALNTSNEYIAFQEASYNLSATKTTCQQVIDHAKQNLENTRKGPQYSALMVAQQTLSNLQNGTEFTAWQAAKATLAFVQTAGEKAIEEARRELTYVDKSNAKHNLDTAGRAYEAIKNGPLGANYFVAQAAASTNGLSLAQAQNMAEALINAGDDAFSIESITIHYNGLTNLNTPGYFAADINYRMVGEENSITIVQGFDFTDLSYLAQKIYQSAIQQLNADVLHS